MKVGIVTEYYYPLLGGISEHVHNTGVQLTRMGHDVRVITPHYHGREELVTHRPDPGPFEVIRIGRSIPAPWNGSVTNITVGWSGLWHGLRAIMTREQFDIVHVHSPLVFTLPPLAILAARCHRVATFHSYFEHSSIYSAIKDLLQKQFLDRLDGQIAVSESCIRALPPYFTLDARIIPNGIDTEHFSPNAPRLEAFNDGKINLLFLSRFEPRNGLKLMLNAYFLIRKKRDDVRLIIVGDGPERQECEAMVPPELANDIHFEGAVLRERPSYYATADIYCAPISKASFGMTLLESMAAGTPIVATENDGYRDLLGKDEGIMVPVGDPELYAAAIMKLIEHKDLREQMGQAGLKKAQRFAWSRVTEQLVEFYEEILPRPRRVRKFWERG